MISGCSASTPLYTAGLTEETAAADADGSGTIDDADSTERVSGVIIAANAQDADSTGPKTANTEASVDTAGILSGQAEMETDAEKASQTEPQANPVGVSATLAGVDTSVDAVPETEAIVGYVYVCGAVREPGVYPIRTDMRVCDAVGLAGGFSEEADEEWLNQAATLYDGQKLYIYTTEETDLMKASGMTPEGMSGNSSGAVAAGTSGTAENGGGTDNSVTDTSAGGLGESSSLAAGTADVQAASDGKVNINTATRDELMTLPGIGESKADAIVAYRDAHGVFASIEEIQNISGIKSGVFSQIKDLITV
ncbi:MAG: helix-hairpin-helix domain-containing protein [Clostridiales bacterium]|nr:helix-hairpin-helix domain-containing protein [Clostridiales bacterium]